MKYLKQTIFLFGFLFLFASNSVVAQDTLKKQNTTKIAFKVNPKINLKELNEFKVFIKSSYNIILEVSDFKTNVQNEIISLNVKLDDLKGSSKSYKLEGLKAIKPFYIYVLENIDDAKDIDFGFENYIE